MVYTVAESVLFNTLDFPFPYYVSIRLILCILPVSHWLFILQSMQPFRKIFPIYGTHRGVGLKCEILRDYPGVMPPVALAELESVLKVGLCIFPNLDKKLGKALFETYHGVKAIEKEREKGMEKGRERVNIEVDMDIEEEVDVEKEKEHWGQKLEQQRQEKHKQRNLAITTMMHAIVAFPFSNEYITNRNHAMCFVRMMDKESIMCHLPACYLRHFTDALRGGHGIYIPVIDNSKTHYTDTELQAAAMWAVNEIRDQLPEIPENVLFQVLQPFLDLVTTLQLGQCMYKAGRGVLDNHWPMRNPDQLCRLSSDQFAFFNDFNHAVYIRTQIDELITSILPEKFPVLTDKTSSSLSVEQSSALRNVCENRFHILTGYPGVGKTFVLSCIFKEYGHLDNILFLCPFNKAVVRAQGMGIEAVRTIHSFIAYCKFVPWAAKETYAKTTRIFVDESSVMAPDTLSELLQVMYTLPCGEEMCLVLIGDPDQLPPVNNGSIFADIIAQYPEQRTQLTEIRRTDAKSLLSLYASMRSGEGIATRGDDSVELIHKQAIVDRYDFDDNKSILIAYRNKDVKYWNTQLGEKHAKILAKAGRYETVKPKHFGKVFYRHQKIFAHSACKQCGTVKGMGGIVIGNAKPTEPCLPNLSRKRNSHNEQQISDRMPSLCLSKNKISILVDGICAPATVCMKSWSPGYALTSHQCQGSEWPLVFAVYDFAGEYLPQQSAYTAVTRAKDKLCLLTNAHTWKKICKRKMKLEGSTLLPDITSTALRLEKPHVFDTEFTTREMLHVDYLNE